MSPDDFTGRPVPIVANATRTPVEAVLCRGLPSPALRTAEHSWRPVRADLIQRRRHLGDPAGAEHGHWDWARDGKTDDVESGHTIAVGIGYDGVWQGLMTLVAAPRPSRSRLPFIGSWLRRPVVYVDYLESAPWNNPDLTRPDPPRFGGVGTQLLLDAVRVSIETGLDGRVGLHSLPQAVPFYLKRGLSVRVGSDRTYYGLPYLEYTRDRARAELARFQ